MLWVVTNKVSNVKRGTETINVVTNKIGEVSNEKRGTDTIDVVTNKKGEEGQKQPMLWVVTNKV